VSGIVNALRIWICECCFPDEGKEAWRCKKIYDPAKEDSLNYLDSVGGQTNLDRISTNIGNESYIPFFRQNTAVPNFPTLLAPARSIVNFSFVAVQQEISIVRSVLNWETKSLSGWAPLI